jgi:hypothetical protein
MRSAASACDVVGGKSNREAVNSRTTYSLMAPFLAQDARSGHSY